MQSRGGQQAVWLVFYPDHSLEPTAAPLEVSQAFAHNRFGVEWKKLGRAPRSKAGLEAGKHLFLYAGLTQGAPTGGHFTILYQDKSLCTPLQP